MAHGSVDVAVMNSLTVWLPFIEVDNASRSNLLLDYRDQSRSRTVLDPEDSTFICTARVHSKEPGALIHGNYSDKSIYYPGSVGSNYSNDVFSL